MLATLTTDYDHLIPSLQEDIGAATNPLTMSKLKNKLKPICRCVMWRSGRDFHQEHVFHCEEGHAHMWEGEEHGMEDEELEDDQALVASQFKGRCHRCGKIGHRGCECESNPPPKLNGQGGRMGHTPQGQFTPHPKSGPPGRGSPFERPGLSSICPCCGK